MKLDEAKTAYTFDDFYLEPQHSRVKSRKDPGASTTIAGLSLKIPIVSAPMSTVTDVEMSLAMHTAGGEAVVHRYMSIEDQIEITKKIRTALVDYQDSWLPFFAVGATGDFIERALDLHQHGVTKFCVDIANGHNVICVDAVRWLLEVLPNSKIMAGNVCTYDGANSLVQAGVHVIRCGIGGGSICTTRQVTAHGVPQLTAIENCLQVKKFSDVSIIADGGIRHSGDIVKAIAVGADAVMIGGLLAGTDESPGATIRDADTGQLYKHYHGMASEEARKEWFESEDVSFVPEGTSFKVFHKGSAKKIIEQLVGGLKVGMSYSGVDNLVDLRAKAKWVRVTDNGRREANPNRKMFSR